MRWNVPLSERSEKNLVGVHADLVKVARRAHELATADGLDFVVTEGLRTLARQRVLVASGASKTMKSRHIPTGDPAVGHAFDFAPLIGGEITWKWPPFALLAVYFKRAADELKVPVVWGGDWKSFKDGPHLELDRRTYP